MLALRGTQELKAVFDKLIKTMNAHVEWNGLFVIYDNYVILKGSERSLIFNLDTRRVGTSILELAVKPEDTLDIGGNLVLVNSLNMLLYAFGKWGTLKGVKVEKNYEQLNRLFKGILKEIAVEPEYGENGFYFYQNGVRATYEDVIVEAVRVYMEGAASQEEEEAADAASGLWHSMVWKPEQMNLVLTQTTIQQRKSARLGNNFYLAGYLCPKCSQKIYMVVYSEDKEPVIDTEEGKVRLARACTCPRCHVFYTPRPEKLLSEGDEYVLDFEGDSAAYEDYLELMGHKGGREANCNFNEYVDETSNGAETAQSSEANEEVGEVNDEGSEVSSEGVEVSNEGGEVRNEGGMVNNDNAAAGRDNMGSGAGNKGEKHKNAAAGDKAVKDAAGGRRTGRRLPAFEELKRQLTESSSDEKPSEAGSGANAHHGAGKNVREHMLELIEEGFYPDEQTAPLEQYVQAEWERRKNKKDGKEQSVAAHGEADGSAQNTAAHGEADAGAQSAAAHGEADTGAQNMADEAAVKKFSDRAAACKGKSYRVIKRLEEEIKAGSIPESEKKRLLSELAEYGKEQAAKETQALMSRLSNKPDLKELEECERKLREYEGADIAQYKEKLTNYRRMAESAKAEDMIRHSRKSTREDLVNLAKRISAEKFMPEVSAEYSYRVDEALEKLDRRRLDEACENYMEMTGEELERLYGNIEQEMFLPKLKEDALGRIERRLARIKTDECEQLILKLKKALADEGVSENERHYFYPARRVLNNETPDEAALIDYAKGTYASGAGKFEYPIIMADTSRANSGKEGMILTPENLYYSSFITCGAAPVYNIDKIEPVSGLLGKHVAVYLDDGRKLKVPCAVSGKELKGYTAALSGFIAYLKERPFSRKEKYLVKEKHETICCFRCGYIYKDDEACPKCGYKRNA